MFGVIECELCGCGFETEDVDNHCGICNECGEREAAQDSLLVPAGASTIQNEADLVAAITVLESHGY